MKKIAALILLCFAASLVAQDRAEEVRKTEIAFAKAFADRDQAAFASFIAPDARFIGRRILMGKEEIVAAWSRLLEGPAPFSWKPDRVAVNAAGDLGFSTGPVFSPDGKPSGTYISTWQRQQDGSWKILFDTGCDCPPETTAAAAPAVEQGFITTPDGVKLHYSKAGSGSRVVIMPAELFLFDDLKQLADQVTLISYDMRNRGRSERVPLEKVSIENDVADLETVRKHFNVERFVPVGYSYLGLVVAVYTAKHPQQVEKMIQIGPASMSPEAKYPREQTHGYEDMTISDEDVKKWRDMQTSGAVASSPREYCEVDWKVMQAVLVGNGANASKLQSHCELENEWPVNLQAHVTRSRKTIAKMEKVDFSSIKVPALVIHGTFDRNAPYGSGLEWSSTMPNAKLLTVKGAAHAAWVDAPEIVLPAIREFLR
jgi:pimeloyl-ACP methyl ester carboxylesterase/ketosteroid isomerase-like protein